MPYSTYKGEKGVWIPDGISREREWPRLEMRALFEYLQANEFYVHGCLDGVTIEFKPLRKHVGGTAHLRGNTISVNRWNPIVIVHEAAHFVAYHAYNDDGHGYWFKQVFQSLLDIVAEYIRTVNTKQDTIFVVEDEFTVL